MKGLLEGLGEGFALIGFGLTLFIIITAIDHNPVKAWMEYLQEKNRLRQEELELEKARLKARIAEGQKRR